MGTAWKIALPVAASVLLAGCGTMSCQSAGATRAGQLVAQLSGSCCAYHTNPTESQLDRSCKPRGLSLNEGRHQCAAWAAECLAELGPQAAPAVPALITALRSGPNDYDTGDGVIPARHWIALALGRSGDARAVQPLLEALRNPRPVDAGPGAAGYASTEPVGEEAAIEALGTLGPLAEPALDDLLTHFARPLTSQRDHRIVERAAEAIARVGSPRVVPALVAALDQPDRARFAAIALEQLGPRAGDAAPALRRRIQAEPAGPGHVLFRRALRAVEQPLR